jgi:aryl-alcohol dehydrogenase-like predicted oxidoreductase
MQMQENNLIDALMKLDQEKEEINKEMSDAELRWILNSIDSSSEESFDENVEDMLESLDINISGKDIDRVKKILHEESSNYPCK